MANGETSMAERIRAVETHVEYTRKQVDKIFNKLDDITIEAAHLPCQLHANRIDRIEKDLEPMLTELNTVVNWKNKLSGWKTAVAALSIIILNIIALLKS